VQEQATANVGQQLNGSRTMPLALPASGLPIQGMPKVSQMPSISSSSPMARIQRTTPTVIQSKAVQAKPAAPIVQRPTSENSAQPADGSGNRPPSAPEIDVDELVDKVQRRLMRRLTIESERRGGRRWP